MLFHDTCYSFFLARQPLKHHDVVCAPKKAAVFLPSSPPDLNLCCQASIDATLCRSRTVNLVFPPVHSKVGIGRRSSEVTLRGSLRGQIPPPVDATWMRRTPRRAPTGKRGVSKGMRGLLTKAQFGKLIAREGDGFWGMHAEDLGSRERHEKCGIETHPV